MSGELEQAATGSGGPMPSASSPSSVELATSLLAGFTPDQIRQLYRLHLSRGRDFGDGHGFDPEVQECIRASNQRLQEFQGHPWLRKKRVKNIPRHLDDVPFPLFPPKARGQLGDAVYVVVGVLDTVSYLPILCHPTDPLGQFSRPVPMAAFLNVEQALGLSGCRYSTISYHRRFSLLDVVEVSGGSTMYRTREFISWLEARSLVPVVSF
jgi:hypothetical protein